MSSTPQDDFARLFIENQGRLYGYIATLLPNRDDAEEVLQRTSMVLWQKWEQFDAERGFLPWARAIALNEIRNLLRRSERRNVHLSEPVIEMLASEIEQQPDERRSAALSGCLDRLQQRQRELVERCYLGSSGINAIAESLGLSPAALYMRLHRIRKNLVECVNRELSRSPA
ncbi:sigma-70 family RNA polymerase sigma factor [Botrimarina sp.]|uniref:sigma-70 family RNA polymerase sigma factor n=1 Tax=Botrimarina sp. TaxID=2795802 RepID=UPI0032EF38EE